MKKKLEVNHANTEKTYSKVLTTYIEPRAKNSFHVWRENPHFLHALADRDLQQAIDRFITHYAQNWMADYDADEVGEYLVEECGESFTGDYQVTVTQGRHRYPATRASFLRWRQQKNNKCCRF